MGRHLGRWVGRWALAGFAVVSFPLITSAQSQRRDYVPGEVLVRFKAKTSASGLRTFMGKSVNRQGMALKRSWSGINLHKFSVGTTGSGTATGANVETLIRELEADPDVAYAEPNYYIEKQADPNQIIEPMSLDAFASATASSYYGQTYAPIDAPEAWQIARDPIVNEDYVTVAIIDTGIDYTHRVFTESSAIWENEDEVPNNGIDDDRNGYVDDVRGWNFVSNSNNPLDDDGHGTHVAGIVLGTTLNIKANPVEGAKIRLMALKFLDSKGVGTTSDAIEAIYYAANNGARVLNNSWGGGGFSSSLVDAIHYAYTKKTVFVAAAGNNASNNDSNPTYPANYKMPNLISVAASTDSDRLADFSNFGAHTVHMGSPGKGIYSTYPGNTFAWLQGTSMATPFVSGTAALMLREKPDMNGYQIANLIFDASESVSGLNTAVSTKARLNVYNSVGLVQQTPVDDYMPEYDPSANVSRSMASAGAGVGGCGLVAKSMWDGRGGGPNGSGPHRNMVFFGLLCILLAPIVLSAYLRQRNQGRNKRQHTRYFIDSQVRVRVGDRELVGNVSTISLGGMSFNTDAWLEQGGIVTMQIQSPDGKDVINVDGKIVWSEEQKRYGVAFQNAEDNALAAISRWTQALLKA